MRPKRGKGHLKHLISVVTYRTFLRWLQEDGLLAKGKRPKRKPDRPRTDDVISDLILIMGRENGCGYTRILGELKRLFTRRVCRTTVRNILNEAGLDPGPKRGHATWDEFIRRHVDTLWACDFFTKKVWTCKGLVDIYVLFFIHYGTRRVHVTGMTTNPDAAWVIQQAKNMCLEFDPYPHKPRFLIHDFDTKFCREFREVFEDDGLEVLRVGPQKPNMNAFAERFVQTILTECLDHFTVFGEDHLHYLVNEFVNKHYNTHRPHQGLGNNPLPNPDGIEQSILAFPTGKVVCDELLGGVIKQYRRVA